MSFMHRKNNKKIVMRYAKAFESAEINVETEVDCGLTTRSEVGGRQQGTIPPASAKLCERRACGSGPEDETQCDSEHNVGSRSQE